ncbi:MAG: ATP synthase delta/epsilon chain alpha-helix domain-containing protein [Anaerobutyricum sp.]
MEENTSRNKSIQEYYRAQASLSRAMARLRVGPRTETCLGRFREADEDQTKIRIKSIYRCDKSRFVGTQEND